MIQYPETDDKRCAVPGRTRLAAACLENANVNKISAKCGKSLYKSSGTKYNLINIIRFCRSGRNAVFPAAANSHL